MTFALPLPFAYEENSFRKHLRRNQTAAETLIWAELRNRNCGGYKFRRQVPIGRYVVDFLCIAQKIIVEIDGPSHLGAVDYDATIEAIWQSLENATP